jgi:signal-transduction protein with cAMP-binding, CBS, and nucleotidyltransferase domain
LGTRRAGAPAQEIAQTGGLDMDNPIRRPEEILAMRPLRRVIGARAGIVWSVGPADNVLTASRLMADKNIGFVIVLDQGEMVGVVSERDCTREVLRTRRLPDATPVSEIMTRKVVTADLTHTFADCLRLMHQHGIRHLPVVDDGIPVAVVSIRDLLAEAVAHHAMIINVLERERLTMFISTA